MFVFSPSGEQEPTVSAPLVSALSVSLLSWLGSHTHPAGHVHAGPPCRLAVVVSLPGPGECVAPC